MGALKLTACMKVVSKMGDMDQEALLERLDRYTGDGVPKDRAQVMAASDALAELQDERRAFMRLLREQHPEIFMIPEDQDVDPDAPDIKRSSARMFDQKEIEKNAVPGYKSREKLVEKKIPAAKQLEIDKNGTVRTNSEEVLAAIRDAGDRRESVDSRSALVESRRVGSEDTQGASNRQTGPGAGDARLRDGNPQDDVYASSGAPTSLAERLAELGGARIEDQELVDYLASTSGGFGAHGVGLNTLKRALVTKAAINNGVIKTSQQGLLFSLPRPAFYSQLQRSIEQVPDRLATMAAPQWKLWLDANASKLGIKKDEIEWSGITDYLELRGKDKVSRDDLVAYLADSGVRVQEVVLGNQTDRQKLSDEYGRAVAASDAAGGAMNPVYIENLAPGDRRPEEQALLDAWNRVNENPDESWLPDAGNPKYGQYTVPGGENYREVLITLPEIGGSGIREALEEKYNKSGRELYLSLTDDERAAWDREKEGKRVAGDALYRSSHWDTPNILAHLRVDDRTDADGNKVLFINEIQSDWGQDGKKKGIKSEFKPTTPEVTAKVLTGREFVAERSMPAAAANAWLQGRNDIRRDLGKPPVSLDDTFTVIYEDGIPKIVRDGAADPKAVAATHRKRYDAMIADARRRHELDQASRVPAAPFISDTKAWVALALKRAIMLAVEGGHDKVALITGAQAADLYDLSKQISKVEATKMVQGKYAITASDLNGTRVLDDVYGAGALPDVVGKELAERIVAEAGTSPAPGKRHSVEYSGLDLKVGGEGMRAFYDQIVPQVARDVLKKLGGGQLGDVRFNSPEADRPWGVFDATDDENEGLYSRHATRAEANAEAETYDGGVEVRQIGSVGLQPGFDITPAMREKVASGVPLFSKSRNPQVDTPEFRRWFGDSKVVDADGKPLVVYHGTTSDIKKFSLKKSFGGFYFTPSAGGAYPSKRGGMTSERGLNVMPAYLAIENPLRTSDPAQWHQLNERRRNEIEADGFDGVIVEGPDGLVREFIAFRPEQIKSATGNRGTFDPSSPDITKSLPRIPGLNAGPVERTTGDYGREYTPQQLRMFKNVGRTTSKPALIDRLKEARKDLGKKMAQGIVDQFRPIRELGGNAYTLARLSKGSAGAFEALLGHGKLKIVDGAYDADTTGGFLDLVGKPLGKELEDFMFWVASNRAETLSLQDREHLFTQEDIDAGKSLADGDLEFDYLLPNGAVTRDRRAAYEDSLKKFNEFNKNVLDIAEQSGLIDGESRQFWEGEFYVPFYRVSEEDGEFVGAKIKGGLARQRAFHELKGGSQKLNSDLLANTMRNWAHLIDASAKNRAAKATLEAAQAVGIALESDAETVRQLGKSMGGKGGTVWFMDGGQQRHFLIGDPYLLEAINSLEYAGLRGPLMDALSTMKHWLTVGVTASPAFKVRNLIRDSIQAISLSGLSYNPVKNLVEGYKATDRASQDYVSALASGGLIRFGTMLEGNAAERVRRLVQKGVPASTILNTPGKVKDFYGKFVEPAVEAYQELGNRGEEINRASLYKQLRAQGVNHAEASLMARDLMDFSMQGTWTSIRFLTQVVPFLNARLQGLYKLGRGAAEDPKRFAMVAGATAMVSVALLGAYGDDDDWKKREDWDRDGFWWFKFGGTAFRIPKPFEVGAIATLAERGVELFTNDEFTAKRFGSRVMHLLGDNLAMNPIPQAVKPMLDIYANKDSFSGRPIESMGMERLQSEYRYNVNTSMIARGASSALNAVTRTVGADSLSPVQIDSLIRGYFGWLGTFVVAGADMAVRPLTSEPARPQADYLKVVTQGFLRTLPEPGSKYVSAMYDQAKILEQAFATHRQMLKEGKLDEAREFAAENKDLLDRYRLIEAVKKTQSNVNRRIREIEISDMDPARKRDEIQKLRDQADRSARAVY